MSTKGQIQIGKYVFDFEIDESTPKGTVILKSRKSGKVVAKITNIGEEETWTIADQNDLEDDQLYT